MVAGTRSGGGIKGRNISPSAGVRPYVLDLVYASEAAYFTDRFSRGVMGPLEAGEIFYDSTARALKVYDSVTSAFRQAYTGGANNFAAAVAPTINDDVTLGYGLGSRWFDTTADEEYVCFDATDGAAVWKSTTSAEQALSALSTGLVKVTTGTGVLSTAVAGTDYGTLSNVSEDTSPTLGGNLDLGTFNITKAAGSIQFDAAAGGVQVKLGDALGVQQFRVADSGGVPLAAIDSDGRSAFTSVATPLLYASSIGGPTTLQLLETATPVNWLTVSSSDTSTAPTIGAAGSDTNIDLTLTAKGTGAVTTPNSIVIGTGGLTNAAIGLELQSTTKVMRLSVLTTAQRDALAGFSPGMIFYNFDLGKLQFRTGAGTWETVTSI